jgi:UPF0755 protein
MTAKKKKTSVKKIILSVLLLLLVAGGITGYYIYRKIYGPNINMDEDREVFVNIPTGSGFEDVVEIFSDNGLIRDEDSFRRVASAMSYTENVKPGRYRIMQKMSNREVIRLLRSGREGQTPVDVVLRPTDGKEGVAGYFGRKLEADSNELVDMMSDRKLMKTYGFTTEQSILMFIPDTYKFYWNTSAKGVFERMAFYYKKFWNAERQKKAKEHGLTQVEVGILASIVEKETSKLDEMPVIAGVYMNRLEKKMLLQADPTVIFALQDPTIRRVLNVHKDTDSPYNTYRYTGLPPGPIFLPSQQAIDAVLNRENHNYIYFCAKEDFSGYHNFAVTVEQHNVNARKYQQELNKRRIYK